MGFGKVHQYNMVKKKEKTIKKESKRIFWANLPAWLKGGIIGAIIGIISAIPIILLMFNITSPKIIILTANYIYLPVIWCFVKLIFLPLAKVGITLSANVALFSILIFGAVFYFLICAALVWLVKKIIQKRKEIKNG